MCRAIEEMRKEELIEVAERLLELKKCHMKKCQK